MSRLISPPLRSILFVAFFYAFHVAATAYSNSSFLKTVFGIQDESLTLLYTVGSLIALISIFVIPSFLKKKPVRSIFATTVLIALGSLAGLVIFRDARLAMILFPLYLATNSIMIYLNDFFVSHYSTSNNTGRIRSIYLTIMNIAWVTAPLLAGILADSPWGYAAVYGLAFVMLIISTVIAFFSYESFMAKTGTGSKKKTSRLKEVREFFTTTPLRRIFMTNGLLQTFYATMVIFSPLYLHQTIGLSYTHIGFILAIMLLAFPIFQIPAGYIADKYFGEKEMLATGLIIMGSAAFVFATTSSPDWWVWAVILFVSRIGASLVEIMNESYFFKHVNETQGTYISIFRSAYPLAYSIAPLLISILITQFNIDYRQLFMLLALLVTIGAVPALMLEDTK